MGPRPACLGPARQPTANRVLITQCFHYYLLGTVDMNIVCRVSIIEPAVKPPRHHQNIIHKSSELCLDTLIKQGVTDNTARASHHYLTSSPSSHNGIVKTSDAVGCTHYHVAQVSLPFQWFRAGHLLDLALLGVPFVRCRVRFKTNSFCYSKFLLLFTVRSSASSSTRLVAGLIGGDVIAYTQWRRCWLLGQG